MAQLSPLDPRIHLESQIRECYGRCAYTHKIHEKMAENLTCNQKRWKYCNIILSALITGGAVGTFFKSNTGLLHYTDYATVTLSIISLVINAYLKDFDPGALAQQHKKSASDIWNIRESYLSLISDIQDKQIPIQDIRNKRDALQLNLHQIYLTAPSSNDKAYAKAQNSLKYNEELMFTEQEIDNMLPKTLRRTQ